MEKIEYTQSAVKELTYEALESVAENLSGLYNVREGYTHESINEDVSYLLEEQLGTKKCLCGLLSKQETDPVALVTLEWDRQYSVFVELDTEQSVLDALTDEFEDLEKRIGHNYSWNFVDKIPKLHKRRALQGLAL